MRKPGSKARGGYWSEEEKMAVWRKGMAVKGYDKNMLRRDCCGAWMKYTEYGLCDWHEHGWEVDHIKPVSKGGTDDLENLQPLHWRNNRKKADSFPPSEEDCECRAY